MTDPKPSPYEQQAREFAKRWKLQSGYSHRLFVIEYAAALEAADAAGWARGTKALLHDDQAKIALEVAYNAGWASGLYDSPVYGRTFADFLAQKARE